MHTDTLQLVDEWGPEKVVCVSDRRSGMPGVLVIDNSARGNGKGGTRMSPDVIANAGGVIAAAYSMDARCSPFPVDPDDVFATISAKMRTNTLAVLEQAHTGDLSTHAAAREVAQQRVRAAMTLRGQIPVGAR